MMPLMGHLEELRKRILLVAAVFATFFILAMCFVQTIYRWLLRGFDGHLAVLGPGDITA
ncbi:hypothetical protein BpJC4_30890 [Weizmannia acidilactici]|nr:hypothetical protein BpJC4_30890 [Weizmannia acidilactici]GER73858.1 hypothetical protein BpPP18_19250 [Weizmannia acidilactici]